MSKRNLCLERDEVVARQAAKQTGSGKAMAVRERESENEHEKAEKEREAIRQTASQRGSCANMETAKREAISRTSECICCGHKHIVSS